MNELFASCRLANFIMFDKSSLVPFLAAAGVFATLSWINVCHRIIDEPVMTKQVFVLPYW